MLAIVTGVASDDLQQHRASVHHQLDTPVVAALYLILLFHEHLDGGTIHCCRTSPHLQAM